MTEPAGGSWFTRLYDPLMVPVEFMGMHRRRHALVADAVGRVLEVGAGTGLNLPHYRDAQVVIATDPEPAMLWRTRRRAARAQVPVRLVVADVQALPFPDGAFDTVIATCVFCTVPDPEQGFRELHRVLKPGGELRLLEHVRASSPAVAQLQDRLTPTWSRIAGGCCLNRPTLETVQRAGFHLDRLESRFGGVVLTARLYP